MRVGLDAREAFRRQPRGIGLYVRHLMRELAAVAPDHEFLLYHRLPHDPGELPIPPNMRAVRADMPGDRFHTWERVQMPWRIRRDGLSVYHGTYNTLPPRWPLWKGPPMVVSLHDVIVTWWDDDFGDPYVRYCRKVTRRVLRDAARILTVSEWSKKDIAERFDVDPDRITLSLNGLHPDFLAGAPPGAGEQAGTRHADGRPYLFAIGAGLRRKNTARLIAAYGLLLQRRPDLPHLLLVSGLPGEAADPFRAATGRAGVEGRVRFLPYLDRAELIGVYAGADLTVYPSLVEGWGIPVLESLVLGVPVVTSNTTAMPEAGSDHARYFDPHDEGDMAEQIGAALDARSEFDAIRDAAVARARTFTWRRTAEGILQVYREVTG